MSDDLAQRLVEASARIFDATQRGRANWIKVRLPDDAEARERKVAEYVTLFGEPEWDEETLSYVWRTPPRDDEE